MIFGILFGLVAGDPAIWRSPERSAEPFWDRDVSPNSSRA